MGNINRDNENEELMHWDNKLCNRSHYPEIAEGIAKSQPEKANIIQPQTAVQAEVMQVPLSATTPNAQAAVVTVDHTYLKEFMATMKYPWDILKDPNANQLLNYLNKLTAQVYIHQILTLLSIWNLRTLNMKAQLTKSEEQQNCETK
ncbi:hypothetical protein M422DRAFT_272674 [Sphaerobolus stellatus SS14]|uniref:Uncharacterized protein n=1 Tax=Sphaerobolus stellatus (strain SS14) TaxID=990650 RepID=A0A0C9UB22_SPHS4|nr:hypothetical protein M422DRAFT_272674 [Sphaerobolus stellatus SS14]